MEDKWASDKGDSSNDVVITSRTAEEINPVSTAIPPAGSDGSITWTASEFVQHQKGPLWYVTLLIISAISAFIIWLVTKDVTTAGSILVAMLMFAIWAAKKPRELEYRVDNQGVHIGGKTLPFELFRSFAIDKKGAFSSLVFFPLKRFSLLTVVYYDPADEAKIVAILSSYLPMQEKGRDLIDDLMWKIRF